MISRNSPCHCGSGRRFKDCHGALAQPATEAPSVITRMNAALAAQQKRDLTLAEQLYREALALDPIQPDALHMLGVVVLESGRPREAVELIGKALALTDWRIASFRHNFGLALARLLDPIGVLGLSETGKNYRSWRLSQADKSLVKPAAERPLVSVLIPSYNHARFLDNALRSVFEQSYRNIEIIVIDDGSTDDSPSVLESLRKTSPFPFQLHCRENRGAAQTLNEAATLARGVWLHPLNSDDAFAVRRIETMVTTLGSRALRWGFGNVLCVDETGSAIDPLQNPTAFEFACMQSEIHFSDTVSDVFLSRNPAVTTGNLLVARDLFTEVGGFRDHRYHHDWDFCLRAAKLSEPAYVADAAYHYRWHASNTINETNSNKQAEIDDILSQHLESVFEAAHPNPWFSTISRRGINLISVLLSSGVGKLLPREKLEAIAKEALSHPATTSVSL